MSTYTITHLSRLENVGVVQVLEDSDVEVGQSITIGSASVTGFDGTHTVISVESYALESVTDEGDLVWIWANKASVNFFTGRRTMEPYIFPHVLLYPDFVPEDTLEKILNTLEEEQPIIVDMSWNDSILPSIVVDCNFAPSFDAVCRFVDENYEVTGRLHDGKSRILQWKRLE